MIPSNNVSRVYDPHTLSIMAIAFDRACDFVPVQFRDSDYMRRKLASHIIRRVNDGESDRRASPTRPSYPFFGNPIDAGRRSASRRESFADWPQGVKAADMPVEQPTRAARRIKPSSVKNSKPLNGLDDWARSSNRICRFLALEGDFLANSILRIPRIGSRDRLARADGAGDLRCGHASGGERQAGFVPLRLDQIIDMNTPW